MNGATDAYFYGRCAPLLETLKPAAAAATTTTTECIIDALHKASNHGAREGTGVGSMPCDPTIAALPQLRDGEEIKLATH